MQKKKRLKRKKDAKEKDAKEKRKATDLFFTKVGLMWRQGS